MPSPLKKASDVVCADRMRQIQQGRLPVEDEPYLIDDFAERYQVHRATVYKGVKSESPPFPVAHRMSAGFNARLHFTPQSIRECDARRTQFYKSTPSWNLLFGDGPGTAPLRRAATDLDAALSVKRDKTGGTPLRCITQASVEPTRAFAFVALRPRRPPRLACLPVLLSTADCR